MKRPLMLINLSCVMETDCMLVTTTTHLVEKLGVSCIYSIKCDFSIDTVLWCKELLI